MLRAAASCSQVNSAAPQTGPVSVWMPPSITITRPSTERWMPSDSGEIEPLENAYSAPARPAASPAMVNAAHCVARTSMPMASARSGESRAGAQRVAERRIDRPPQEDDSRRAEQQRQEVVRRLRRQPGRRPDADQAVRAAGQRVPLVRHRPGDLREGERQHRGVHAREPHAEPAEHQRAEARGERRQRQREFHRQFCLQQQEFRRRRRRGRSRRRGRRNAGRPGP